MGRTYSIARWAVDKELRHKC